MKLVCWNLAHPRKSWKPLVQMDEGTAVAAKWQRSDRMLPEPSRGPVKPASSGGTALLRDRSTRKLAVLPNRA